MESAQITLTEAERRAVQTIGENQGKSEEEVLREAVVQFLAQHEEENRLSRLRQGRGIWKERQDLPDFAQIRREMDRL